MTAASFQSLFDLSAVFGTVFHPFLNTLPSRRIPEHCSFLLLLPSPQPLILFLFLNPCYKPDFWGQVSEVSVSTFTSLLSLHLLSISASSFSVHKRMQYQCLNVYLLCSPEWNIQLLSSWMASDTTNLKHTKISSTSNVATWSQVRNSYCPDYCNNCPTGLPLSVFSPCPSLLYSAASKSLPKGELDHSNPLIMRRKAKSC